MKHSLKFSVPFPNSDSATILGAHFLRMYIKKVLYFSCQNVFQVFVHTCDVLHISFIDCHPTTLPIKRPVPVAGLCIFRFGFEANALFFVL